MSKKKVIEKPDEAQIEKIRGEVRAELAAEDREAQRLSRTARGDNLALEQARQRRDLINVYSPVELEGPPLSAVLVNIPGRDQVLNSTRREPGYRSPWQESSLFNPDYRDKRRAGETPAENKLTVQYKLLFKQAEREAAFWLQWLAISKSVLDFFSADLKKPMPIPAHIVENLTTNRDEQLAFQESQELSPQHLKDLRAGVMSHVPTYIPTKPGSFIDDEGTVWATYQDYIDAQKRAHKLDWIDELGDKAEPDSEDA